MNPFPVLLGLFVFVPLLEIYLFIQVGSVIGAIPTVFLVVFTAVLGVLLLRAQGFSTLRRAQLSLAAGEIPALEILEGVLLLLAGAMLLTPGFFTDTVGFLLLVPACRRWLIDRFLDRSFPRGGPGAPSDRPGASRRIIEGEWRREDEP